MRKILFVLESRATYGYAKNVLDTIKGYPSLHPQLLVTGAHLNEGTGKTIEQILADGYSPDYIADFYLSDCVDTETWPESMGRGMSSIAKGISELAPDIVLLFGDRAETLVACIAAAYINKVIAHVQAGDKSGHIDDSARYAIAKFSHIHFASCDDSAKRLLNLGEQHDRIHNVGAPQLDDFHKVQPLSQSMEIESKLLSASENYILLVQHPVMNTCMTSRDSMIETIEACISIGMNIVCIYPNVDSGSQEIIDVIESYLDHPLVYTAMNLARETYLSLLAGASALVGNSSSGILEAPSFRVPVVNIGTRQRGRPQSSNIINCDPSKTSIESALSYALSPEFRQCCSQAVNLYGDGNASERICNLLDKQVLNDCLLDKITTF